MLFNAVSEQESEKYTAKNKGTCDISQYGVLIVGVQKKDTCAVTWHQIKILCLTLREFGASVLR